MKKIFIIVCFFTFQLNASEMEIQKNFSGSSYVLKNHLIYILKALNYLGLYNPKSNPEENLILLLFKNENKISFKDFELNKLKLSESTNNIILNESNDEPTEINISTYEKILKLGKSLEKVFNNTFKFPENLYISFNENVYAEAILVSEQNYKQVIKDLMDIYE